MSERLTPKEIKHDIREDELTTFVGRVFEKIEENPRVVVGTVIGIIGLVLLVSGTLSFLDSRENRANERLAEALEVFNASIVEDTSATDEETTFATVDERRARAREALAEVKSGSSAEIADLLEADLALEEGDTATARDIWEDFLDNHSEHILAVSVRLNLIHLDRAEGKAGEVAETLQQELDSAVKPLPEDVLLFELAQTREALGETDAATELYQRILDEYPSSPYTAKARKKTTTAAG